ncbi:protein kinase [Agaribacter marinus]|uniref:non-specific serine/threonine protein kinase n=1 Tax=Virgibacillus salarius TaxID=447199 RepID=A0A941DSK9_9BACI|nr:serine/threonine-protein kinase [Virgibacillus salarius]MBR7796389.1 serine/threonine protein kinase [Virgibacillus salarius]NAZ09098.1 protein kinase [Agaribacter marinus]WBX80582.1 serine/threonine-protein kinase [Virgibacillus salarius]
MKVIKNHRINGKYRVKSFFREGGTSQLYEVVGPKKQIAVLKVVKQPTTLFTNQITNEAKILAAIDHTNVPTLFDIVTIQDHYKAIIMEKFNGTNLADFIEQRNRRFQWDEVLEIGKKIADIIQVFHRKHPSIVIRDIKPSNILLTKDNTIHLIDFGTSVFENESQRSSALGTIGFAAPEQFEKGVIDKRSDLFSLGATLFYLISDGENIYTITNKSILNERAPKSFVKVILKLTETDAEKRFNSIEHVIAALKKVKLSWRERTKKFG